MNIPAAWDGERLYYEKMDDAVAVKRDVADRRMTFLVQPVTTGFLHACTVDDICRLLAHVPPGDLTGIDLILLRQPTRKQRSLNPVWGRLAYFAETGKYSGRSIVLEAGEPGKSFRWSRSLTSEGIAELDRLRADGHAIEDDRRGFTITPTLESIRATQLYRTFPHELGHHVDYLSKISEPAQNETDYDRRRDAYFARPKSEREAFAHRYADEQDRRLRAEGVIPFARLDDSERLEKDGLNPAWFISV